MIKKSENYNDIGKNYNTTRKPDTRIYDILLKLIDCTKRNRIIDVGAGTGNYSYLFAKEGFIIDALEPSKLMYHNSVKHNNLNWILSAAENIPIDDNFYDGGLCTLAYHHFSSLEKSFSEICRVLKQNKYFIIFTADPRKAQKESWINEYFYELVESSKITLPNIDKVSQLLEKTFKTPPEIIPFNLPYDLKDSFFYSGWKYPEKYLSEVFRNGISSFSLADKKLVDKLVLKLKNDLDNKKWDENNNNIRSLDEYNCGYYFIKIKKGARNGT